MGKLLSENARNSLTKVNEISKKEKLSGKLVFMYLFIRTHELNYESRSTVVQRYKQTMYIIQETEMQDDDADQVQGAMI